MSEQYLALRKALGIAIGVGTRLIIARFLRDAGVGPLAYMSTVRGPDLGLTVRGAPTWVAERSRERLRARASVCGAASAMKGTGTSRGRCRPRRECERHVLASRRRAFAITRGACRSSTVVLVRRSARRRARCASHRSSQAARARRRRRWACPCSSELHAASATQDDQRVAVPAMIMRASFRADDLLGAARGEALVHEIARTRCWRTTGCTACAARVSLRMLTDSQSPFARSRMNFARAAVVVLAASLRAPSRSASAVSRHAWPGGVTPAVAAVAALAAARRRPLLELVPSVAAGTR